MLSIKDVILGSGENQGYGWGKETSFCVLAFVSLNSFLIVLFASLVFFDICSTAMRDRRMAR